MYQIRKTCTKCKAVEGDVKFRYGANICNPCRGKKAVKLAKAKKNNQTEFEKMCEEVNFF